MSATLPAIEFSTGIMASSASPLAITPRAFRRQCSWLARHRQVVDLATAVADRALLLHDGELTAEGTPAEVLADATS